MAATLAARTCWYGKNVTSCRNRFGSITMSSQTTVGLRYAATSLATVFTMMGAVSVISPEQAQELIADLHGLNDSIVSAYGYLVKMWVILGPVIIFWLGKLGVNSSTVKGL